MITSITGPPDPTVTSPTRHVRTPVSNAKKRRKLQAQLRELRELDMAELVDSDEEDNDEDDAYADPEDGLSFLPAYQPSHSRPVGRSAGGLATAPMWYITHNVMHSRADLAYCH